MGVGDRYLRLDPPPRTIEVVRAPADSAGEQQLLLPAVAADEHLLEMPTIRGHRGPSAD